MVYIAHHSVAANSDSWQASLPDVLDVVAALDCAGDSHQMSILSHLLQDIAWRKKVSTVWHFKGVGHVGESQREGKLVATALCLNITSLPVHSGQFGNGVEGKMACKKGNKNGVSIVGIKWQGVEWRDTVRTFL